MGGMEQGLAFGREDPAEVFNFLYQKHTQDFIKKSKKVEHNEVQQLP